MIRRLTISALMALCLVLTGVAAGVAQTRMALAGGYCGTGSARILLDGAGVPILTSEGEAIAAPDCPICHLPIASTAPAPAPETPPTRLHALLTAAPAPLDTPLSHRSASQARAPPSAHPTA